MKFLLLLPTLAGLWTQHAVPADDGHMRWTGSRSGTTPILRYRHGVYTARAVAFAMQTGREPDGPVTAGCGVGECVAPAHMEDRPLRIKLRTQMRVLLGGQPGPAVCRHGHDQTIHGGIATNGRAYCRVCRDNASQRGAAA